MPLTSSIAATSGFGVLPSESNGCKQGRNPFEENTGFLLACVDTQQQFQCHEKSRVGSLAGAASTW